jgi:hypothetical protein
MIKKQVRTVKIHAEKSLNPPKPLKSITNNVKKLNACIEKLSISKQQPVKKLKKESSDDKSSDDKSSDDESSDDERSNDESSNDESSNDESSNDESSNDESSNDESSNDESSNDESSNDESSKNATKLIKNKVIVDSNKPIVKIQTKRKFDEYTSKQLKEIITKTGNLVLSQPIEKQKSPKKAKLEKDYLKKEWENPSLDYPIIDKELRIVDNIKTKYVSFIDYNFTGKPAYCKYWNSHFSKNCEKNIFEKHWDLLPAFFIFLNYNDSTYTSKMINYSETVIVHEDDIKIQVNQFLTVILRPVSNKVAVLANKERQENSIYFKNRVIHNLQFSTHCSEQVNIYNDKKILDPLKSWALHLILNENKLSITQGNTKIRFSNDKKEFIYPLITLYQSLYLYFSHKITT